SFWGWAKTIAIHLVADHYRRPGNSLPTISLDSFLEATGGVSSIADMRESDETLFSALFRNEYLERCRSFEQQQLDIIRDRVDGHSVVQIASTYGVSVDSTRSVLNDAFPQLVGPEIHRKLTPELFKVAKLIFSDHSVAEIAETLKISETA